MEKPKTKADLAKNQLTLSDALKLIYKTGIKRIEIHYRVLINGQKGNVYFSDCLADDPGLTVERFIEQADNYGSFWLEINGGDYIQIVSDETFEPL